jgi:hypothetical protein
VRRQGMGFMGGTIQRPQPTHPALRAPLSSRNDAVEPQMNTD